MSDEITECSRFVPPTSDGSSRTFELSWWTESVWELARAIDAEWAFDGMAILADALEEAGCDDEVILRHCRECQQHEPDCWVLTTLLLPPSFPPNFQELEELKSRDVDEAHDVSGQGYPRYRRPMPSPLAILLMMVIALVVMFGLRIALFGN